MSLPSTNIVRLYTVTPAGGEDVIGELERYFRKAGYEVRSCLNASVEDLRTAADGCSVFFFNTHGIYSPFDTDEACEPKAYYALQTGTIHTDDPFYADELKNGFLGLADGMDALGNNAIYLTITYKFLQKYWRFTNNSFVFVNGCHAFDDALGKNSIYRTILDCCNASAYGGWTKGNVSNCDFANLYLFDRLLGTNCCAYKGAEACPPNRPFDLDSVTRKMSTLGLDTVPYVIAEGKTESTVLRVDLNFRGDFSANVSRGFLSSLAPSIESADLDERGKSMFLSGSFDSDPSKIRVFVRKERVRTANMSGVELILDSKECDEGTIVCSGLPDRGEGSAGYLVVAADYGGGCLIESNPVPITSWVGKFTYTMRLPGQDPHGSGIGQIRCNAFLRGDIHRYRLEPDGEAEPNLSSFSLVRDETNRAQFTTGGEYVDKQGRTYKWHGSGDISFDDGIEINGFCQSSSPTHPGLFVLMQTLKPLVDIAIEGQSHTESFLITTRDLEDALNSEDVLRGSLTWEHRLYEPSYDIPAPPLISLIECPTLVGDERVMTAELTWETLKAKYAPDEDTPG